MVNPDDLIQTRIREQIQAQINKPGRNTPKDKLEDRMLDRLLKKHHLASHFQIELKEINASQSDSTKNKEAIKTITTWCEKEFNRMTRTTGEEKQENKPEEKVKVSKTVSIGEQVKKPKKGGPFSVEFAAPSPEDRKELKKHFVDTVITCLSTAKKQTMGLMGLKRAPSGITTNSQSYSTEPAHSLYFSKELNKKDTKNKPATPSPLTPAPPAAPAPTVRKPR